MTALYLAWSISAVALVVLAAVLGRVIRSTGGWLGILIDHRGRFSLTHFQIVMWTLVILPLISGLFWGRLLDEGAATEALSFDLPSQVLGLLGITVGSSVAAGVVKSAKDNMAPARIAASSVADRPRLSQIFLLEEGEYADRVVDITKFQNFVITLILIVAYVALAIGSFAGKSPDTIEGLPDFSGTFLTLLGISHAAYIAGKLPNQTGAPPGLTMANRGTGDAAAAGFAARRPPERS